MVPLTVAAAVQRKTTPPAVCLSTIHPSIHPSFLAHLLPTAFSRLSFSSSSPPPHRCWLTHRLVRCAQPPVGGAGSQWNMTSLLSLCQNRIEDPDRIQDLDCNIFVIRRQEPSGRLGSRPHHQQEETPEPPLSSAFTLSRISRGSWRFWAVPDGSGWIGVQPADEGSVKASLTGGKVTHLAAEVTFSCHMVPSLHPPQHALLLQASGGLADSPPEGFCPGSSM